MEGLFRKGLNGSIAAVLLAAIVMAGCTNKNDGAAESSPAAGTAAPATETAAPTATPEEGPKDPNVNATGYPIVKEKITLKMFAAYWDGYGYLDFKDMELFKQLEEKTNIHIEWTTIPQAAYNEKLGIVLSTNDLPDAFFSDSAGIVGDPNVINYASEGMIVKLDELVDKYMPNLQQAMEKRPQLKSMIKYGDGSIYALPFYQEDPYTSVYNKAYINKVWLDKLGLAVPETTEQFYEVLKRFKEDDPNGNSKADEIPFTFLVDQFQKGPYGLFGAFGLPYSYGTYVEYDGNGKAFMPQMTEPYKNGIKWLNRLFAEGLIDKEAFTHTNVQYAGKGKLEPGVIGVYMDFAGSNMVGDDRFKDYVVLKPLKGPDGHQQWPARGVGFSRGHFVITNQNQYPEATVRWADEFYDELLMFQFQEGPLDIVLKDNGNDTYSKIAPPEGVSVIDFLYTHSPKLSHGFLTEETLLKLVPGDYERQMRSEVELFEPYVVETYANTVALTNEQSERSSQILTDLSTLVKKKFAEWVMGSANIDNEWDNYIKELNQIGANEYIEIMQAAGDAVK